MARTLELTVHRAGNWQQRPRGPQINLRVGSSLFKPERSPAPTLTATLRLAPALTSYGQAWTSPLDGFAIQILLNLGNNRIQFPLLHYALAHQRSYPNKSTDLAGFLRSTGPGVGIPAASRLASQANQGSRSPACRLNPWRIVAVNIIEIILVGLC